MKSLSKRDKRVLSIGAVVIGATLLILYVILPFFEAQADVGDRLELKQRQLRQYVQAVQQQEQYRVELEEIDARIDGYRQKFLDARDSGAATSQIEQIVRSLADQNGVRVARSNPLQERRVGDKYSRVTLQFQLDGEVANLATFLYEISSHPKYLLVEEFALQAVPARGARQPQSRNSVRLNVSGFIRLS